MADFDPQHFPRATRVSHSLAHTSYAIIGFRFELEQTCLVPTSGQRMHGVQLHDN